MAGRGKEERILCQILEDRGFSEPSQRVQKNIFPVCTPARGSGGRGRGAVFFDIGRRRDGAFEMEEVLGLKASKRRKSTITATTGKPEHIQSVLDAGMAGADLPVLVSYFPGLKMDEGSFSCEEIYAAVVSVGELIRAVGGEPPRRTVGQGKGKDCSHPLSWGEKKQTSKAGKTYVYVSLQVSLKAAGIEYRKFVTMESFLDFIEESCEGIYL